MLTSKLQDARGFSLGLVGVALPERCPSGKQEGHEFCCLLVGPVDAASALNEPSGSREIPYAEGAGMVTGRSGRRPRT